MMDYLYEEKHNDSDGNFLYRKYGRILFERLLSNNEWSIVVLIECKLDYDDVVLILKMAEKAVLFLSIYNENFM